MPIENPKPKESIEIREQVKNIVKRLHTIHWVSHLPFSFEAHPDKQEFELQDSGPEFKSTHESFLAEKGDLAAAGVSPQEMKKYSRLWKHARQRVKELGEEYGELIKKLDEIDPKASAEYKGLMRDEQIRYMAKRMGGFYHNVSYEDEMKMVDDDLNRHLAYFGIDPGEYEKEMVPASMGGDVARPLYRDQAASIVEMGRKQYKGEE